MLSFSNAHFFTGMNDLARRKDGGQSDNYYLNTTDMIFSDYVTLRFARLRPKERWSSSGSGLNFLFIKSGVSEYLNGQMRLRLTPGCVLVANRSAGGALVAADGGEVAFWHFSLF